MEKLSVATAIIGLLAVGGRTIDKIWDLNTTPSKETAVINQALLEVRQCRSTVHVLYKTLALLGSSQLPFPERGSWIEADDLIATLTDTVLAFSELQGICDAVQERCMRAGLAPETICSRFDIQVTGLCSRMRWHNLSMTMMMTILKCPGEADAETSRLGLERRMTRLLTSNSNLSSRMSSLDAFDARGVRVGGETLPHYTYTATSGQTSLPTPSSSPPSTYSKLSDAIPPPPTSAPEPTPAPAPIPESIPRRIPRSQVWSPLSGYTLADIPVISMLSLPVTSNELCDGNIFYTFAFARQASRNLGALMNTQLTQGAGKAMGQPNGNPSNNNGNSNNSSGSRSADKASGSRGLVERMGLNITARKRNRNAKCR